MPSHLRWIGHKPIGSEYLYVGWRRGVLICDILFVSLNLQTLEHRTWKCHNFFIGMVMGLEIWTCNFLHHHCKDNACTILGTCKRLKYLLIHWPNNLQAQVVTCVARASSWPFGFNCFRSCKSTYNNLRMVLFSNHKLEIKSRRLSKSGFKSIDSRNL